MSKRFGLTLVLGILAVLLLASPASAAFGVTEFDVVYENEDGTPVTQAGSHPYALSGSIDFDTKEGSKPGVVVPDGLFRDVIVGQPAGLVGDREAVPYCSTADFLQVDGGISKCPPVSQIGLLNVRTPGQPIGTPGDVSGAFNLQAPPGVAAKIGFVLLNVPVAAMIRVNPDPPHNLIVSFRNTSTVEGIGGSTLTVWGNPLSEVHDDERFCGKPTCPLDIAEKPFLTMPRSCTGPLINTYEVSSWEGETVKGFAESHDDAVPPNPLGLNGCGKLAFNPTITAKPTTLASSSPTGLDFTLDVHDEGLTNSEGLAHSDVEKAVVTLPEGFSVNPSIADGLEVCSQADLARETAFSDPGDGCPNASKIGSLEVETPLLDEAVKGSLYQAAPYDNPFNSLIALYMVLKNPALGISITQPVRVEPDPVTGKLTTYAEDLPQLPFSHFKLHFREGTRSPLASPHGCGSYNAEAKLYPSSGTPPTTTSSAFQIITGPGGGSCPTGGLPPFRPGLIAGTINNAAGRFSPFYVRLGRNDGEQEITHFSIKLPPGVIGKLAGIPFCSEADIAKALSREEQPHGGQEELDSPSCPATSQIGHTLAGAGVGPSLTYAPGKVYLAGPYHGAPISFVAITAGVVGPFDIGNVVVRQALRVNPETGEVFVDATGSDPIPHIVEGFPVDLRDIRVYVDRPQFVLNPTNCSKTSTASTVLGAGLNFASEADDNPLTVTSPFQAADCAQLPFEPKLTLRLRGGTNRGAHPALIAHLQMHGFGEAGVAKSQVTLPHSEFIENSHFKTICTRVQFNAGGGNGEQCPADSIYGHASASTPILSEPVEGPVFLRSNPERELPDVVAALHGAEINADLVGHVDSVKGGGIRTTFEGVPDAPVSEATFAFDGKAKGLFVNSTNLCKGAHRATVSFTGQNGKVQNTKPALKVNCPKARKGARHRRTHRVR
jgi:hypothetical protein